MKFMYIVLIALPLCCLAFPADKLDPISVEESDQADDSKITKRSGGLDLVTSLKTGLLSGLGRASASIASGSSGSSSGYKEAAHGNSIEFDPWSLKKSVLNTLFQAVKAITGGVTAIKGQLIKGSGYALSASGKVVAIGGDKVTDVGKAIIHSASLVPVHEHGSVHPFSKFSSLSGASSSGHAAGPVVHTETITSYEVPAGHASYGPPSKPPSFSSATHQYLPPGAYGGQPFSGHAAYEDSPTVDFLSTKYGVPHDGHDDFLSYGISPRKPTTKDAVKAAEALKEILHLIPEKTGPPQANTYDSYSQHVDLASPPSGPLHTIQHTESITASYGAPPQSQNYISYNPHPSDVYRQMSKQKTNEQNLLDVHPDLKYANYHNQKNSLNDLTPVIAALQVHNKLKAQPNTYVPPHKPIPPPISSGYNYPPPPPPRQSTRRVYTTYYSPLRQGKNQVQFARSKRYQIADPLGFNRELTL